MTRCTFAACGVGLLLAGCPAGRPSGQYRPIGHGDVTLSASPAEDVLVFNAAGEGGRDLYLFHLADRRVNRVAATVNYETWPSFSGDGKLLAYAASVPGDRADHIFVRSLTDGSVRQVTNEKANDCSPQFSPDGSLIVFARDTTYSWGGLAANWDAGGVICLIEGVTSFDE